MTFFDRRKRGAYTFFDYEKRGARYFFLQWKRGATILFSKRKRGAATFFHNHILGGQYFFIDKFEGAITFFGKKWRACIFFVFPISDFPDFLLLFRMLRHLCNFWLVYGTWCKYLFLIERVECKCRKVLLVPTTIKKRRTVTLDNIK